MQFVLFLWKTLIEQENEAALDRFTESKLSNHGMNMI